MFRSLIAGMSRHYRRVRAGQSIPSATPLLDEAVLRELALYARSLPDSLLEFHRPSSHPLIGEVQSLRRGQGLEFEDNRPYQAGDEPRLLNWRQYARSGELYTKVFAEERRPQVFLLLDRRAGMRFATRGQLKVSLAAKLAVCFAQQAQRQALAVGGVIVNQAPEWFTPAMGDVSLQALVHAMAAPCPPLAFDGPQPGLGQQLQPLLQRLPQGSFVLLLSDFADLDVDAPVLHELATVYTVRAIQILDPIELQLPEHGNYRIEDGSSPQALRIAGRDHAQRDRYAREVEDRQAGLRLAFRDCAIPFETFTTQDDVATCLGQPAARVRAH
jgi:uncharacterized protein (DUF58 family)